jgi:hypothetical protein
VIREPGTDPSTSHQQVRSRIGAYAVLRSGTQKDVTADVQVCTDSTVLEIHVVSRSRAETLGQLSAVVATTAQCPES